MAKGSRRRISRHGKNSEGCLWGLFSMLDFHHARDSPRMLSNREHGSGRIAVDDGYLSDALDLQTDFAEKDAESGLQDQDKVQDEVTCERTGIMVDEEASNTCQAECSSSIKDKQMISVTQCEDPSMNSISRNKFAESASHFTAYDLATSAYHTSSCPNSLKEQLFLDHEQDTLSQVLDDKREKDHGAEYRKNSHLNASVNTQSEPNQTDASNTLSRRFLQDFFDKLFRMEGMASQEALHHYEELINALDVLTSNEELLSELLQEPDSRLMECIQKLQNIHAAKVPESTFNQSLQELNAGDIPRNERGSDVQKTKGTLKKIVILKPIPSRMEGLSIASSSISSHRSLCNSRVNTGNRGTFFHFSFQEIKRRLRHAGGEQKKERKFMHTDTQESHHRFCLGRVTMNNGVQLHLPAVNSSSPGNDDGVKKQHKEKPEGHCGNIDLGTDSRRSQDRKRISILERENSFQREAKKHLIEMLHSTKDDHELLPKKHDSKALWNVLSLQDYNFSHSTGGCNNSNLSPPQMRFSPLWSPNLQHNSERVGLAINTSESLDSWCTKSDIEPCMLDLSTELTNIKLQDEKSAMKAKSPQGHVKVVDDINCCKTELFETFLPVDEISDNNTHGIAESDKILTDDETPSPRLDSPIETKSSTPSTSPSIQLIHSTEIPEVTVEKMERPSPVSVLIPPFLDDAMSSSSPMSEPREDVGLLVSPRELFLDEHGESEEVFITPCSERALCLNSQEFMGEEEFRLEYIASLLEVSGLFYVEAWERQKSLNSYLDSSLFDEVEIPLGVVPRNIIFLFDCICEVLEGIHEKYFPQNVWAAFIKPNVRPFPCRESLIKEVYGRTACQHATQSQNSLTQVIEKDLDTTVWMDISAEIDELGIAIEDEIMEEILEELVLDIFD